MPTIISIASPARYAMKQLVMFTAICLSMTATAAPRVSVGLGYYAILPDKLLLTGSIAGENDGPVKCQWTKQSGPGDVTFERPNAPITWAKATVPGTYVFQLRADHGAETTSATTTVNVIEAAGCFGNPILPGMFPDPHVYHENDEFYIYATSMENLAGAYGRASVWTSPDFVNWEMRLTNWPVFGKFGGDIWAPDILKKDGKYYQFVTRSGSYDTWIGVADQPEGPWTNLREDDTPIVSGGGKAGRIVPAYNMDAQPFMDDDGQVYMYWGWSESMAAKLTPDLRNIEGEVHFLKGTKWLPNGGELPQWLTVDLGESQPITSIVTSPEFRDVAYGYTIELSDDGKAWRKFVDRSANRTDTPGDGYIDTGNDRARLVRITFHFTSGHWAGLYDFQVFSGDQLISRGKPVTASSTRGNGSEPGNAVDASTGPNLADFVEGSYMIKRGDTYYLLYSSGALHDGSYSVHYAMGEHPLGPFLTPKDNVVLKSNQTETTKGPGHNSVLGFKDQYYIVYHQHNQPHEDAGGVFRQTCADRLEFNPDGTIQRVVPTQAGVGALLPMAKQDEDVAFGKYAKASSVRSAAYSPEFALDRNNASKWCAAANASYPQSLTVDLAGSFEIDRVETSFEYPTLAYPYVIETSLDGITWAKFANRTDASLHAVSPHRDFGSAKAAWIRITVNGCERPENAAGIHSFKVFRAAGGAATAP